MFPDAKVSPSDLMDGICSLVHGCISDTSRSQTSNKNNSIKLVYLSPAQQKCANHCAQWVLDGGFTQCAFNSFFLNYPSTVQCII